MSSGFSLERLKRLHEVMAGHVGQGVAPGLVTLVSRRGETHVDAIGTTAVGGNQPMRRGCVQKPVTRPPNDPHPRPFSLCAGRREC